MIASKVVALQFFLSLKKKMLLIEVFKDWNKNIIINRPAIQQEHSIKAFYYLDRFTLARTTVKEVLIDMLRNIRKALHTYTFKSVYTCIQNHQCHRKGQDVHIPTASPVTEPSKAVKKRVKLNRTARGRSNLLSSFLMFLSSPEQDCGGLHAPGVSSQFQKALKKPSEAHIIWKRRIKRRSCYQQTTFYLSRFDQTQMTKEPILKLKDRVSEDSASLSSSTSFFYLKRLKKLWNVIYDPF